MTEAKETEFSTKNTKLSVIIRNINSAVEPSLTQQCFLQKLEVLRLTFKLYNKDVVQSKLYNAL